MISELPPGTTIGTMQASLDWVLSHSVRFLGAVLVTVPAGEGLILVSRGKPCLWYLRHGGRGVWGKAAQEYFSREKVLTFSLRRYTDEEFTLAFAVANREEDKAGNGVQAVVYPPLVTARDAGTPGMALPGTEPGVSALKLPMLLSPKLGITSRDTVPPVEGTGGEGVGPGRPPAGQPPASIPVDRTAEPESAGAVITSAVSEHEQDSPDSPAGMVARILFGQILLMPGVISVSIFNQGLAVLTMGEVNMEDISVLAEDLISQAIHVARTMHMGDFIQMTLQIPGGNVIIAPFHNEYLCILTTPEINLAQIRRLLRDIQRGQGGLPL